MNYLPLIARIIKRHWWAGELQLLLMSLIIATVCLSSVNYFSSAIQYSMGLNASSVLGGNLVITSSREMPHHWLKKAQELHLRHASALTFLSMLSAGDNFQLAAIKAVSQNYPLIGAINVSQNGQKTWVKRIPARHTIWLEKRLFDSLQLRPQQRLNLGDTQLRPSNQLNLDPSLGSSFFSLSPKALINMSDVEKTHVIQPGSRIEYYWYFTGSPQNIAQFQTWLQPKLSPSQELLTPDTNTKILKKAFERIDIFLKLSTMISFILCGIVIALSVHRFLQRHQQNIALMRCFGSSYQHIFFIYFAVFTGIGCIGITIGSIIGYLLQPLLIWLTQDTFNIQQSFDGASPILSSYVYGFILLYGFSLQALRQLKNIPTMVLLRESKTGLKANLTAQLGTGVLLLLMMIWWQLNDVKLALTVVVSLIATITLFAAISYLIIRALLGARGRVGISWRYGLSNLSRQPQHTIIQLFAFSVTFSVILLICFLWQDLSRNWQQQLPFDTPNYFAFNITAQQVEALKKEFKEQGVTYATIYPMVRGRIIALNDKPILSVVPKKSRANNALHRELNLSWSADLPPNNHIIEGAWWNDIRHAYAISVEEKLAHDLGFKLGDELMFQIGAEKITTKISSIRSVDWLEFTPNFYVIFPNDKLLKAFSQTYVTSFYLTEDQTSFASRLLKKFPNLSVLDVAAAMRQVRDTILGFAKLTGFLNAFILFSGIAIVFASTGATLDRRIEEALLLRVLGASRKQVLLGLLSEFIIIGFIAGLISIFVANSIAYYVSTRLLGIPFHINLYAIITSLVACPGLVALTGWLSTRAVRMTPIRASINTD